MALSATPTHSTSTARALGSTAANLLFRFPQLPHLANSIVGFFFGQWTGETSRQQEQSRAFYFISFSARLQANRGWLSRQLSSTSETADQAVVQRLERVNHEASGCVNNHGETKANLEIGNVRCPTSDKQKKFLSEVSEARQPAFWVCVALTSAQAKAASGAFAPANRAIHSSRG